MVNSAKCTRPHSGSSSRRFISAIRTPASERSAISSRASEAWPPAIIGAAIEKCRATRVVGRSVEEYSVVMPVHSPSMPSPAEPEKRSDRESDSKVEPRSAPPNARNVNPVGPRCNRISVHCPRIVRRNVNNLRIGGLDIDLAVFILHVKLLRGLQIAGFLRSLPHLLHGLHYIILLVEISVTEFRRPSEILAEVGQHGRILHDRLDAWVPRLLIDLRAQIGGA